MNVEQLKASGRIIMECVAGSHMYGINRPDSDKDIRGLFRLPSSAYLSIKEPPQEIADDKQDIKYYELRKFIKLASECNPNIIELLWVPDDCMLSQSLVYNVLRSVRKIFISKMAEPKFLGYAFGQIRKAKGQNKKINEHDERVNEEGIRKLRGFLAKGEISVEWLEERFNKNFAKYVAKGIETGWPIVAGCRNDIMEDSDIGGMCLPRREDFCFWIDKESIHSEFPARPVKVDFSLLDCYGASSVEHVPYVYRLYHGQNYSGLFKDGEIVCSSIPKERERIDFIGLLIYNSNEYQKAKSDYDSFWEWMANKNPARWVAQENKEMNFDSKNFSHVFRLLFEAKHIAMEGEPKVRLEGEELNFVRDVRSGKYEYEFLLAKATYMEAEVRLLFEDSDLPKTADLKKIDELYFNLLGM